MQSAKHGNDTQTHTHTHIYKPVCKKKVLHCCGNKQYTQTQKLQQIGQI